MNVLILSESLDRQTLHGDFTRELARISRELGHNVTVLTSDQENDHPRVPVLRPFRTWGLSEIQNGMLVLESYKPDVLHVIEPHGELLRRWLPHLPGFLMYAKMRFRAQVLLHLLEPPAVQRRLVEQLSQLVDLVTSPSFSTPFPKQIEMPFFPRLHDPKPLTRGHFLLIPSAPTQWKSPESTVAQLLKFHEDVAILADWNYSKNSQVKKFKRALLPSNVTWITQNDLDQSIGQCLSCALNILELDLRQSYLLIQTCIELETHLIVRDDQVETFRSLLDSAGNYTVSSGLTLETSGQATRPMSDDGANALSRIYSDHC